MSAPDKIKELTKHFQDGITDFKSGNYNEARLRIEFLNPFFKALGWDVDNEKGYAEGYKEVIHEDSLRMGKSTKNPDYSFRVGGTRKFVVEAKKPSVRIKDEIDPAFQLRSYAWTAGLPLSILTDFEEFSVYDCRIKPFKNDKASVARIAYFTFDEYDKKWEEIAGLFSPEAILKGSFDRYAKSDKGKKGTSEVDSEFLKEIEGWREKLAKSLATLNKNLDLEGLNHSVQLLIDRIIFLRIAEAREVEEYKSLLSATVKDPVYRNLNELFIKADEKYNSGLFEVKEWVTKLKIDDDVLKSIITGLYYPDCPYEFSVLPIEILGSIYERFLGKTIRLTASHQAKIEEKEEVRKAGGVYYTPKYIVEYIVQNTVGEKVKELDLYTHPTLRILDPACGSGSFLVGAYSFLLQKYLETYTSEKYIKKTEKLGLIYPISHNAFKLTIEVKQQILIQHIFGVDIDPQAVEVTKLSLLLKLMEDENLESAEKLFKHSHIKVLPDLKDNIKCGNSLIGSDFYAEKDMNLFGNTEMRKVNVFDWEKEFEPVFKDGGFDVVIGNPPWIDLKGHSPEFVNYYFKAFKTTENRINVFAIFLEKALNLISRNKRVRYTGFITPSSYLTQSSYKKLREFILNEFIIENIVKLPDNTFQGVTAESAISIFSTQRKQKLTEILIYSNDAVIEFVSKKNAEIHKLESQKNWKNDSNFIINISLDENKRKILAKIESNSIVLQEICDFSLGITPYDKYKGHSEKQIKERAFHSEKKLDKTYKPLISGKDIYRYFVNDANEEWIKYGNWLGAPREEKFFTQERILIRQIVNDRIFAGFSKDQLYNTQIAFNLLLKEKTKLNLKVVLGILNSKLMSNYHREKYLDPKKKTFQKILIQDCKQFPIPKLNLSDPKQKSQHDRMVSLVDQMLETQKNLHSAKTDSEKGSYQKKIEILDKQIDTLVYELYGLTDDEIAIVEGAG